MGIHEAAAGGDLKQVRSMLEDNPDLISSKTFLGETPLHWAAQFRHEDVVELLLARKADANARDNLHRTPLLYAASNGQTGMVKLLLAAGADVNVKVRNSLMTPLHGAAASGHKDVAQLLLAAKADVNAEMDNGYTPLHYAVKEGHDGVAQLLRKCGARETGSSWLAGPELTDEEARIFALARKKGIQVEKLSSNRLEKLPADSIWYKVSHFEQGIRLEMSVLGLADLKEMVSK